MMQLTRALLERLSGMERGILAGVWWNVALLVGSVAALPFDHRRILGLNPWIKPIKFEISVIVFLLTVGLLLEILQQSGRAGARPPCVSLRAESSKRNPVGARTRTPLQQQSRIRPLQLSKRGDFLEEHDQVRVTKLAAFSQELGRRLDELDSGQHVSPEQRKPDYNRI